MKAVVSGTGTNIVGCTSQSVSMVSGNGECSCTTNAVIDWDHVEVYFTTNTTTNYNYTLSLHDALPISVAKTTPVVTVTDDVSHSTTVGHQVVFTATLSNTGGTYSY